MHFWLGLFLAKCFFVLTIQSFNCPRGSDQVPRENVCMIGVPEPVFYMDAFKKCLALRGIPAKIQNIYENMVVFTLIPQDIDGQIPYIGVERKPNNTWTYSDGSPLTYQNWALNEPNMSSNSTLCAIMDPQTGQWLSAECSYARPFFCSINGDDVQCPDGWVYNARTDFCYYLQNFTFTDGVTWQVYNWTTAEANCQRMNSHLVSIHSKEEDDFVYDLVASNVSNMGNVAPGNNPCYYQRAWIGYYGSGPIGTGTWTDGSPVDYIGFPTPVSYVDYWMISNDASCNLHQWDWWVISDIRSRFVCKMTSKSRSKRELFELIHRI